MTDRVTVRDVLDLPLLAGARMLGGAQRAGAALADVALVDLRDEPALPDGSGLLVVLVARGESRRWEHVVDVLVRRVHGAGGGALLMPDPDGAPAPAATRLLADRLGVPVVSYPAALDPLDLALAARTLIRTPEVEDARTLMRLAPRAGTSESPDVVLRRLETVLDARATLVATSGEVVAGARADAVLDRLLAPTHPGVVKVEGMTYAVLPLAGPAGPGLARVCLARAEAGPRWGFLATRALALVQGDLMAWLAAERVRAERTARRRGTLFTEVVEHGVALAPDVADEARALGWSLTGWHLGVHVQLLAHAPGRPAEGFADAVAAAAAVRHLPMGPLVERSDGWTGWLSLDTEPTPASVRATTGVLRQALAAVAEPTPGLRVVAGVGSAHEGPGGIAVTVAEARQAALAATPSGEPVQVRVVDELGAARLLLGWYATGSFRDLSRQILAPLVDLGDEELLATVSAYLERSCSAAHTARALGVHRNTVGLRIARAEKALGARFGHADTRLAVQLALRSLAHTPNGVDTGHSAHS